MIKTPPTTKSIKAPRHMISNNVAFRQVWTHANLRSLLLSLETANDVR